MDRKLVVSGMLSLALGCSPGPEGSNEGADPAPPAESESPVAALPEIRYYQIGAG